MTTHLRLKAYGKISLTLSVLGRRQDGCHEARMIMQTVGFHDRIDLYWTSEPGIRIETNLFYLPTNKQNLACRAAELLMNESHIRQGTAIHLRRFIPVSASMAGGSTGAASVLFGVDKMFRLGLTTRDLVERGAALGADIPYCLIRGAALSERVGEELFELPPMPQCRVLIAKPGISISTKTMYERLDAMELAPENYPDIDGMVDAIRRQGLMEAADKFGNVLELITGETYLVITKIEQVMRDYGAVNAMMNSSGPIVFGLFTSPRTIQSAYEVLRFEQASELARQVYLANFFSVRRNQQQSISVMANHGGKGFDTMEDNFKVNMNGYLLLRDVIFSTLRRAILEGKLAPGERLMKIQPAEKLGVSRTPIREAVRKLELEGLVLMVPGKGAEVTKISERSLRDVLEVRRSLEELAVELACQRMSEGDMDELERVQGSFRSAVARGEAMAIAETDEHYHNVIHQGTGNDKLVQILNDLREQMYRYRPGYIRDEDKCQVPLVEHEHILKALRNRDIAEAKSAAREHIDNQEIVVSRNIKERETNSAAVGRGRR